jgi:hypothetical protein
MDIRFISSLTADDEERYAPALLMAVGALLDRFQLVYTLRIETSAGKVLTHSHPPADHGTKGATHRWLPEDAAFTEASGH